MPTFQSVTLLVFCLTMAAKTTTLSVLAATDKNKIHFDVEFDDFPGLRYTPWASLSSNMRELATTAGYTTDTWNTMGTAPVEGQAWDEVPQATRQALQDMGFGQETWDCYVNHYDAYSWNELVQEDMADAARILGFTPQLWDNDGIADTDRKKWDELTNSEQWAAAAFCYFADTFNKIPIPDMNNIPTIFPRFRYVMWDDMLPSQRTLATAAGWEEESWNTPDKAKVEFEAFYELGDGKRQALLAMGFYEEQYDCYVNHYYGYSWAELVEWGLAEHFMSFGWTETSYASNTGVPDAWSKSWDELNDQQKESADALCWFKEVWNEMTIEDWDEQLQFPQFRFTQWRDLSDHKQKLASSVGWTRLTWNVPGTADVEKRVFDDQSLTVQDALRRLGFYSADQYDCYVNHYNGLDWDELEDYQVLEYVLNLGWTRESWEGSTNPPASEDKYWDELSEPEKEAANELCYFAELWDKSPLTVWEGVAWPEERYWPWRLLDSDEKQLLQKAGWTETTWDRPGTAGFEFMSWNTLPASTRESLEEWGFYRSQWNCYMNHYDDYDWFELVMEDVAQYFVNFGWTEDTWRDQTDIPEAWSADWDDLSDAQRDAAWEICYVRETWDDVPLTQWSESTRSGGPMNNVRTGSSSDDKGRPGLWVFLVLLVFGTVGGYYYYRHKQSGKETFDPTAPTKEPPSYDGSPTNDLTLSTDGHDHEEDQDEKDFHDVPVLT